jgi:hypothetical protein
MGWPFMLLRYALDIPVIMFSAYLTNHCLPAQEKAKLYTSQF